MRLTWWELENRVKAIACPETTDDARDILLSVFPSIYMEAEDAAVDEPPPAMSPASPVIVKCMESSKSERRI
jgi:hypothetical protein